MAYDTFGSHTSIEDQPAEWVDSMMATQSAEKHIKNLLERRKQEEEKKEMDKQKNKSRPRKKKK